MSIPLDSSGGSQHFLTEAEVSYNMSKKEVSELNRFTHKEFKYHPRVDEIREALKVLQPEKLLHVLKKTGSALNGKGGSVLVELQDIPLLTAQVSAKKEPEAWDPGMGAGSVAESRLNASAEMTALLAKIIKLTSDSSLQNIVSKLRSFNAMIFSGRRAYSDFASDLEAQGLQWAGDTDALIAVKAHASALMQGISEAQLALKDAQNKLSDLQIQAETEDPVSPLLQKLCLEANRSVNTARLNLNITSLTYDNYVITSLTPAIKAESISKLVLNSTLNAAKALIDSLTVQQQNIIQIRHLESEADAKSLTFLIALMSKLINQNAGEVLKATAELKQKLSQAAAQDAIKRAQEYDIEVRKAEDLQKTMGCTGKVVAWIITVVSFAAAAFTGGTSLIFASIALALALGDEIDQAVNGHSFMQEAMQPIMENIIQPLMKILADAFAHIVAVFGADKAAAEMAGQIMGAVAVAALMIAGVILVGMGVGKVYGAMMQKIGSGMAKTTLQRIMDSVVGQMLKRISQGFARSSNISDVNMARVITYSHMAVTGGGMANTVIQSAGSIAVADMLVVAAKARAKLMNDSAMQALLDSMMSQALDAYTVSMEKVNAILVNIASIAENQLQAGKYILKKMSHVAG